jgi:hypothetical protein
MVPGVWWLALKATHDHVSVATTFHINRLEVQLHFRHTFQLNPIKCLEHTLVLAFRTHIFHKHLQSHCSVRWEHKLPGYVVNVKQRQLAYSGQMALNKEVLAVDTQLQMWLLDWIHRGGQLKKVAFSVGHTCVGLVVCEADPNIWCFLL